MRILLFAGLAEALGRRELPPPGEPRPATVGELAARLRQAHPGLGGRSFRVAVNRRYEGDDAAVREGDEVALIPPVSGG